MSEQTTWVISFEAASVAPGVKYTECAAQNAIGALLAAKAGIAAFIEEDGYIALGYDDISLIVKGGTERAKVAELVDRVNWVIPAASGAYRAEYGARHNATAQLYEGSFEEGEANPVGDMIG